MLRDAPDFLIAGETRTPSEQVQRTFERKRAVVACNALKHFLFFDRATFHELSLAEALLLVDKRCAQVLATLQA